MKLSGMRDGQKKSVTVPDIPGQLGPMMLGQGVLSFIDRLLSSAEEKRARLPHSAHPKVAPYHAIHLS